MNVKELTHTQQQLQAPNAHKNKQQSDRLPESQCFGPPKGPFFTGSWSWMKSSVRHILSNQQAQLKRG